MKGDESRFQQKLSRDSQQSISPDTQISEIVKSSISQVITILREKGIDYEQTLKDQYFRGEKSQYEFLLPKSKNYRYYIQRLAEQIHTHPQIQRKNPFLEHKGLTSAFALAEPQIANFENANTNVLQDTTEIVTATGNIEQISVGAMSQIMRDLKNQSQPYRPFQNLIYEQEIRIDKHDSHLKMKTEPIIQRVRSFSKKSVLLDVERVSKPGNLASESGRALLQKQFGAREDGSMGAWGGKKYEGLGMRDEYSKFRKQVSKNFYTQSR